MFSVRGVVANFRKYQEQLAGVAKSIYRDDEALSESTLKAFFEIPRHKFVSRYRNYECDEWLSVTDENLDEHLGTIYSDDPLCLKGTKKEFQGKKGFVPVSTISQPSFVLRLIDLLDLHKGQTVFELGTGSGWNAALMAHVVGSSGRVYTAEIITELADKARECIESVGLTNVEVISGDAGDGYPDGAPFDRAMFTAGAFDLPMSFHRQIKEGGKLLFILKNKGGYDHLIVLVKRKDYFESVYFSPCGFVPMTGKHHVSGMEGKYLKDFLAEKGIEERVLEERPFWWGAGYNKHSTYTFALGSFLCLFENFKAIHNDEGGRGTFGWFDSASSSFVHAVAGKLVSYGNKGASEQLVDKIKHWVDIGMPTLSHLELKIFPGDASVNLSEGEWMSKRPGSIFVWSLPK